MVADEFDVIDRTLRASSVDHQPVFRIGLALELLANELAHERIGAVGADDIAGPNLSRAVAADVQRDDHALGGLGDLCQGDAERGLNLAVTGKAASQRLLKLRLIEGDELGMPINLAERIDPGELAKLRRPHPDEGDRDLVEVVLLEAGQLQDLSALRCRARWRGAP